MLKTIQKTAVQYDTWYAFKKELENTLWCHIPNDIWLEIKPKKALPWDDSDMRASLDNLLAKLGIDK
jgi:hypothetical protein